LTVKPVDKVRDLGVVLDNELTKKAAKVLVACACFHHIGCLRQVGLDKTLPHRVSDIPPGHIPLTVLPPGQFPFPPRTFAPDVKAKI